MTQHEAIAKIMEERGGYATLAELYQEAVKIRGVWRGQTPEASIRRTVQAKKELFFKIRPGLWALREWRNRLPEELKMAPLTTEKTQRALFDHTFYQGLLVQLGNLETFGTYVPPQDKNRVFLREYSLGSVATCAQIYEFTYESIVRMARTVDVIWFNRRRLPAALFEVEHTTDMRNAMLKFNELRDFRTRMYIVAPKRSRARFEEVRGLDTYRPVSKYVSFLSYEKLSALHSQESARRMFRRGVSAALAQD